MPLIEPGPLRVAPDWWYDVDQVVRDGDEVTQMSLVRPEDVEEIRGVLSSAFGVPRFESDDYLRWFYTDSPFGEAYSGVTRRHGEAVSHLAGAPRRLRTVDGTLDLWLIANVGSVPGARREGAFLRLCLQAWMMIEGFDQAGIYGVMNDQSRKALEAFGVVTEAELPTKVLGPTPWKRRRFTHHTVTRQLLQSDEFAELIADTDLGPRRGVRLWWHADVLRWRLASPLSTYTLHVADDLVAISTTTNFRGATVAVLMKVLVRAGRRAADGLGKAWFTPSMVGELCAHHRTPFALYVGMNSDVRVFGTLIPQRYLPSPLHLCFKAVPARVATSDLRFDCFELLDFDVL
ncbi:MAG: GNAT family N-acetyltransferase [Microthrixaceae bacterium]